MQKVIAAVAVVALLWVGCGKAESDWAAVPVVEGDQAAAAIAAWRSGVEFRDGPEFPVTMHWEMDFKIKDMPQLLGKSADAFASINVDSTLFGGNNYRSRIVVEIIASDFDNYITVWIESNDEELRIRHRGLDSVGSLNLPFELPAGVRLSANRQAKAFDFLKRVCSQAPNISEQGAADFLAMQGICDLYHPNNIARFLGVGALQAHSRWRESSDAVQVTLLPLDALEGAFLTEELQISAGSSALNQLSDLEVTLEFERGSGAFRSLDSAFSYAFEDVPTRGKVQPSMSVALHMELRNAEVSGVVFQERDQVYDLDESFDAYWPTVAALEPAILQWYQQIADSLESGGDFSF